MTVAMLTMDLAFCYVIAARSEDQPPFIELEESRLVLKTTHAGPWVDRVLRWAINRAEDVPG